MHHSTLLLPLLSALANGAVHTIEVGDEGLTFNPKTITAASGDTVIFELHESHDVIQGDFSSPCRSSQNGFYSGPYSGTNDGDKRFVVNITNDDPIYFYCGVQRHCQNGMVGGINVPSSGDTIDAYTDAARNVDQAETPSALRGGELIDEDQLGSITSSGASRAPTSGTGSPTGSPTGGAASTGANTTPAASGSGSAPQSTGVAAAVIVPEIGSFAAFAMGAAAWFV